MSESSGSADRFYVPKEHHDHYKRLSQTNRKAGEEPAPFRDMKDVFVLSAVLGYRFERRESNERDGKNRPRQHIGFWHYLDPTDQAAVLESIAVAAVGNISVLNDRAEVIRIAEEYAAGGFQLVLDAERDEPEETLEVLAKDLLRLTEAGVDVG